MPIYSKEIKFELDQYWSSKLRNIDNQSCNGDKQKMFILSMFPYPSGQLHMGHMRVYIIADVLARFNRLLDRNVIFPMGWDSFGLPAENAAFERGVEPQKWIEKNVNEMKQQMTQQMSLSIDWNRELFTSDPKYYKWTQWLFCRLFENGLAYQKSEIVNWDPVDHTVLADELIDNEGRSWRSGAVVQKIPLKQWFIRTTALSESLLDGLEVIEGSQWRNVIDAQKGWLGSLEGVYIDFDLVDVRLGTHKVLERLSVFTTKPVTTLTGLVAFVEINKDNIWWNYRSENNGKSQVNENLTFHPYLAVKHPLSDKLIPIIRNPNLKFKVEECLSARLGFPLMDFHDAKLAASLNIPFSSARLGAYSRIKGSAWPQSEEFQLDENLESILHESSLKTLRQLGRGGYKCSRLRTDWLISRQRYWGTPIPIIHCPSCGPILVKDSELPVELPPFNHCQTDELIDQVASPLVKASNWKNVPCPKCGNIEGKRETDTMDTFVDSSWYFLRYLDSSNTEQLCSSHKATEYMPVDIYIGGMEHAIRHLFYARFISHFLHYYTNIKLPNGPEPFAQFLPIGLVLSQTYSTKLGKFVPKIKVEYNGKTPVHVETKELLIETWDKMSKSKNNGINPKSVVDKYGIDQARLIILANTGPDKNRKWEENDVITGVQAWEKRLWNLIKEVTDSHNKNKDDFIRDDFLIENDAFIKSYQSISKKILYHYSKSFTISVVIALMQKLTGLIMKQSVDKRSKHSIIYHRVLLDFIVYLYPISPLLASELWAQMTSLLLPLESIFFETDLQYTTLLGHWNWDLSTQIWNQRINIKSTKIFHDMESINARNN